MSKFFYLAVALICATGCSSSSNVATNVKTVEANSVVDSSVAAAVNQPNANAEIPVNANKIIIQNSAISKDNVRNWDGKKQGSKENTPIAGNIGKVTTAAPDNSEVSSRMNDKGEPLETRTFKKHPVLIKVERTNLDIRNVKVYLKNGKVVNLPEGRIDNFLTAPADDILKAIGVKSGE